jgi:type I restriction enzyme, S subunit
LSDAAKVSERAELSGFRPYPGYRDSGAAWLGQIPVGWQVMALKRRFDVQLGKMLQNEPQSNDDVLLPYLRAANLAWSGAQIEDVRSMWISRREQSLFKLARGDLLVSEGGDVGRSTIWKGEIEPCYIQNAINRVRATSSDSTRFLYYWLYALKHAGYVDALCNRSTISHFTAEKVGTVAVPVPPFPEQHTIAAFLDRETGRIDALVEKKERLIELLKEKRTALITRAVTKGLDPDVPMKDSGVDWLGEIPMQWVTAPVYVRYEVALGKMLDAQQISGEHLRPYLRNVDVQWDYVSVSDLPQMDFTPREQPRYRLQYGDLLVCEGGEVGRTAVWLDQLAECYYQKAIHRVRPTSSTDNPRFFFYLMRAAADRGVFVAGCNPNTIDHLTATQLRHYRFPFPPAATQRTIAAVLDKETAKIDALIEKVREAIERLREYRVAVVSAAVTGKIDLRKAA